MDVSAAWEEHAHDWITRARAPLHDGFWFGTWPVLSELLPAPGGRVVDLGCGDPFNFAQDEAAITTDTFVVSAPYLEPRRYQVEDERDGLPMTFVSMHWPLSTYVNLMARENLVITAIREAGDDEVPWLLAFRAERRS